MASDISFTGLASGIDSASIIEKLMYLERRPQSMIKEKVFLNDGKKEVYSTMNSRLTALKNIVQDFDDVLDPIFEQKQVSSSDKTVAATTITGTYPAIGNFSLTVSALASAAMVNGSEGLYTGLDAEAQPAQFQSAIGINAATFAVDPTQTLASQSSHFQTAPAASGTITVNGTDIDWDNSMTLNEIIGTINNANSGVTATFDAGAQQLTLLSDDTGENAEVTISQSAGNFLEAMQLTPGTVQGTDAVTPTITEAVGTAAANLDIAVTSGTFTINNVIFNVDAATDSLQTVLARINNSSAGVTASYDTTTHRIALHQNETGSSNQVVLGAAGDTSNFLFAMKLSGNNPPVGGAGDTYAGTDAVVSLNGGADQTFTNNTIQGLIPGVTADIKSVGETAITVERDIDSMVSKVKEFVDQYNSVMNYINSKLDERPIEKPQSSSDKLVGAFVGDSLILQTKAELIDLVSQAAPTISGDIKHFSQIGIDTTSDDYGKAGTLTLDENALRAALQDDPEQVEALFNDTSEGIMTQMDTHLSAMTDSVYGSFRLQEDSLADTNYDMNQRINDMEERLIQREERLKMEFANMEAAVAELNSMGSALTSMLSQLRAG